MLSTSQGTYVQIGQTPEVMRETYKCAEWGGLELRIAGSTIALHFKTRCHGEVCEVDSYLPSTASQKLMVPLRFELRSLDSESRVLTITPWNQAVARESALRFSV